MQALQNKGREDRVSESSAINGAAKGHDQSSLRGRNSRVILSLLRRTGALASADIARRTGLSAQTVSNIIRALEADGILTRGESVKGKVGKPSVPVALNPPGVHAFGLSIGRRSVELVLVDFLGREVDRRALTYRFPTKDAVVRFLGDARASIIANREGIAQTVVGLGVAAPFGLWKWLDHIDAPDDAMDEWKELDIGAWIGAETGLHVLSANDATSACVAEHLLGHGQRLSDFAYVFMGAFVGGGLVIDGQVRQGPTGNTAALGPILVPGTSGRPRQLLDVVALYSLEREFVAAGADVSGLRSDDMIWTRHADAVERWITATAPYLAMTALTMASVVEIEAVVLDGAMPPDARDRLVEEVRAAMDDMPTTGIEVPQILPGRVGRSARSVGAALLPINDRFFAS